MAPYRGCTRTSPDLVGTPSIFQNHWQVIGFALYFIKCATHFE
jgi:hypothetical protein